MHGMEKGAESQDGTWQFKVYTIILYPCLKLKFVRADCRPLPPNFKQTIKSDKRVKCQNTSPKQQQPASAKTFNTYTYTYLYCVQMNGCDWWQA